MIKTTVPLILLLLHLCFVVTTYVEHDKEGMMYHGVIFHIWLAAFWILNTKNKTE